MGTKKSFHAPILAEHLRDWGELSDKWCERFADLARIWRLYSSCCRTKVGAIIVDAETKAVVSMGYNGTVAGAPSCNEGGCARCREANEQGLPLGVVREYLDCDCVHAEMNALLLAARRGTAVLHCLLFVTQEPCPTCRKHLTVAGVGWIVCDEDSGS